MANYTETFSGQTTGANSTTFTNRFQSETHISVENPSIGEQDSRVLQFASGATEQEYLQSMDAIDSDGNRDNCEILTRFQQSADSGQGFKLWARASGSGGNETGYAVFMGATGWIYIYRYINGSGNQLAGTPVNSGGFLFAPPVGDWTAFPPNEWVNCRFRVNGTGATVTLQVTIWKDGDVVPGWYLEYADSNASRITSAGWVGVGQYANGAALYYDAVAVATNGDTAVLPAGTSNVRATTVVAEALTTNNSTPVRITGVSTEALVTNNATPVRVTGMAVEVMYTAAAPTGTLYAEDFGSQTTDAAPSGWTSRWNTDWTNTVRDTDGDFGGKFLEVYPGTTDARRLLSYDGWDSDTLRDDGEILVRFRSTGYISSFKWMFGAALRASGAVASEEAYVAAVYDADLYLFKYVAGTYTLIDSFNDIVGNVSDWYDGHWYWLRFRVNGASQAARLWPHDVPEPEYWHVTGSDNSISAAGWGGLWNSDDMLSQYVKVDYVGLGSYGLTVPLPQDTANDVWLNQISIDTLRSGATSEVLFDQISLDVLTGGTGELVQLNQIAIDVLWDNTPAPPSSDYAPIIFINT